MTLDTVILHGTLIDGTGAPRRPAAIGIRGRRIVSIGAAAGPAKRVVDAGGLVVAPGFIDIHTHSCAALLADPRGLSAIHQGVTTQVVGNCGMSIWPAADLMAPFLERYGIACDWTDLAGYASRLRRRGTAVNLAPLVGHGTIRARVMGEEAREPTAEELDSMKALVAHAMEGGAFGLSTGLIYAPGCFATTDEIAALAGVVSRYGGYYATHLRDEEAGLADAVQEAIAIGERTGVRVQISHLKAANRLWWGRVGEVLATLDRARARGIDVAWDQYPYTATSTTLDVFIPACAHAGGASAMKARLRAGDTRRRILDEMRRSGKDWSEVLIISCPDHPEWQHRTPPEIGARLGLGPEEAILEVVATATGEVKMANFAMSEADVEAILRHPVTLVGSDGVAAAADGPIGHLRFHPRSFGTFPRVLGRYVRERRVLTLEEAVRKMTSAPAQRLGLSDRGVLREGLRADITVFDPARIGDRATFEDPQRYPEGIAYVWVNGEPVVEESRFTGKLPGEVLLRGAG